MSYDLAVWSLARPVSRAEAGSAWERFCRDESVSDVLCPDPEKLEAFLKALGDHYPPLDADTDPDGDCPWSSGFSHQDTLVELSCDHTRAGEIASFVYDLAMEHELAVYEFTWGLLYLPPGLAPRSRCQLESPFLLKPMPGYAAIIPDLLACLAEKRKDPYLIAARADQAYMQTLWTKEGYVLEYRDGSPDAHFAATAPQEAGMVAGALQAYLAGELGVEGIAFEKMEF